MHTVARSGISKRRLEFLFDGFLAIAMTLLVLELRRTLVVTAPFGFYVFRTSAG